MLFPTRSIGFSLSGPKAEASVSLSTVVNYMEMTARIVVTGDGTKFPLLSRKIYVSGWEITFDAGETKNFDNGTPVTYISFRMTKRN